MLLLLPHELVHNIVCHLVAHTPIGPPSALLPLLLTCKSLHASLASPALLSRICRFMLDTGAVTRRLFTPYHPDLADHLVHVCLLLQAVRRGDVFDVDTDDYLGTALLMMLDNDGKNYAQLKHAGIHAYVGTFVKQRLWEGKDLNYGWPLHNKANATALWLMWLITEREALLSEPARDREDLVLHLLPFVVCPHLYPSSEAPPNHFDLPLDPSTNPSHQPPIAVSLPNTNHPSKSYPHYLPPRSVSTVYFRARPALSWPLASVAAKLLFVARRELRPIAIPAHIPPGQGVPGQGQGGLTQADYHELNAAKAADLPRGAIWDWDRGVALAVNAPYAPAPFVPAATTPIAVPAATAGGASTPTSPHDDIIIPECDEESRKWDSTFWRMRLCGDFREPRPKFAPGETFKLGSMSGAWQGRIYIPQGAQYTQLLHQPYYPGVPDERAASAGYGLLTENSLGLVMQPIFLDVQEHHRVCGCAEHEDDEDLLEEEEAEGKEEGRDKRGCGVIPVPQPMAWLHRGADRHLENQEAQPVLNQNQNPNPNQNQAPAPPPAAPGPAVHPPHPPAAAAAQGPAPPPPPPVQAPAPAAQPQPQPPAHQQQALALAQLDPETHPSAFQTPKFPDRIDMSMCNAWMPGPPGGVGWVRCESSSLLSSATAAARGSTGTGTNARQGRVKARDEVVFSTDFKIPDAYARGGCVTVGGGRRDVGASLGLGSDMGMSMSAGDAERERNGFVYETWNPERLSSHDLMHAFADPSPPSIPSQGPSSPTLPSHSHKTPAPSASNTLNPTFNPDTSCAQCLRRSKAMREQRRREEEKARRILDDVLRKFEMGKEPSSSLPGLSSFFSASSSTATEAADAAEEGMNVDEDEDDGDVEMRDLDNMMGFGEEVGRAVGDAVSFSFREREDDEDHDHFEEYFEEDDDDDDDDDDTHSAYGVDSSGRIEVLGDDLPNGEPGFYTVRREAEVSPSFPTSTSAVDPNATQPQAQELNQRTQTQTHKRTYIPATRREYDRSRIGVACTGVKDVVITGETGRRHRIWQDYRCYGRVRMWDGLVGILRYSRRSETNSIFIFGYVVGDNNFVGEWRVASSDPLRPVWGSAFVMSKRKDGVPTEQ